MIRGSNFVLTFRFFERIDANGNGLITSLELKNFIMEVNYEEILMGDEIAEMIMRHLDIDGNGNIDKQEFKSGVTKWLKEIDHVASRNQKKKSRANNRVRNIKIRNPRTQVHSNLLCLIHCLFCTGKRYVSTG